MLFKEKVVKIRAHLDLLIFFTLTDRASTIPSNIRVYVCTYGYTYCKCIIWINRIRLPILLVAS